MDRFVERVDSAGVEIVRNTGGDRALRWRFEERVRIRDSLGGRWVAIAAQGQVGADVAGRIYVLDRPRARIAVFDSSGAYLRSLGGRGNGEGSLDTPVSLTVAPAGGVHVFDIGRTRLVEFSPEGQVVGVQVLPSEDWGWRLQGGPNGLVGVHHGDAGDTNGTAPRVQRLKAIFSSDTLELAALSRPTATFTLSPCGITAAAEPLFSPRLVWDAFDEFVVVTAEVGYVLNWFSTFGLWRSVRRTVAIRRTNDSLAVDEVGGGMGLSTPGRPCFTDPSEEVRRRGFAPELPAVSGVSVAPDSSVWVVRGHFRAEPARIDVFTKGGAYRGTLPPGSPIPLGFTPAGDVLGVGVGEDSAGALIVYRIERRR